MKELKRKQDEEELRRREEASRHSVGTDKTDGERSETQSIKSAGNYLIKTINQFLILLLEHFIATILLYDCYDIAMIELTENCFLLHTVCDISNHYIFIGNVSSKLFNYSINFVVITFDYLPIKKLKKTLF